MESGIIGGVLRLLLVLTSTCGVDLQHFGNPELSTNPLFFDSLRGNHRIYLIV